LKNGANSDTIVKTWQLRRRPSKQCAARLRTSDSETDLFRLCVEYFGEPRQRGTSHAVFKTPWQGDPRVNIQEEKGKAKAYQVRQVLAAIDRFKGIEHEAHSENESKS
jgi:hypothetical protein